MLIYGSQMEQLNHQNRGSDSNGDNEKTIGTAQEEDRALDEIPDPDVELSDEERKKIVSLYYESILQGLMRLVVAIPPLSSYISKL